MSDTSFTYTTAEPPRKLYRKLRLIQKDIGPVEMQSTDGDDSFSFLPADGVFEEVDRHLVKRMVLVLPEVTHVETLDPKGMNGKRGARADLRIEVIDTQSGESLSRLWKGESFDDERALSQAVTLALKTFYAATFLIRRVESEPADRHDRRQREARRNLKVTPAQIDGPIRRAREAKGLTGEAFQAVLEPYGVDRVELLPRDQVDKLVADIDGLTKVEEVPPQ